MRGLETAGRTSGPWVQLTARVVLALLVLAQLVMSFLLLHEHLLDVLPGRVEARSYLWFPLTLALWLPALGALWLAGLSRRQAGWVVVGVAVLLQVVALSTYPRTSNDDYRYIWDGKVQLAGVDPYRYTPDAPELARLHAPPLDVPAGTDGCTQPTGCSTLNRPDVRTIYPPVAQAAFVIVRVLSFGGHGDDKPFQVAGAIGSLLVTGLVLRRARETGLTPVAGAVWGWCPVVVSELGNNAHIDWLSVVFVLLGLEAYRRRRPAWAGGLVGAAISVKLYPAVVLPAMLRRRPVLTVVTAGLVVALGYVPHVLAVGSEVIGYLPGYLNEEGYSSGSDTNGSRLAILGSVLSRPLDTLVAVVVLLVAALLAWRRSDPARPELAAVAITGVAFVVATPDYGWYATLLLALVAMSGRWYWLPVVLAPTMVYLYNNVVLLPPVLDRRIYVAAAVSAGALGLLEVLRTRALNRVHLPSAGRAD